MDEWLHNLLAGRHYAGLEIGYVYNYKSFRGFAAGLQ